MSSTKLTLDEFCARFVSHMKKAAPFTHFDDGMSVEEYAKETAPTYFRDQYTSDPNETPEDCADADMSYWGE